jgi:hypothetical protein
MASSVWLAACLPALFSVVGRAEAVVILSPLALEGMQEDSRYFTRFGDTVLKKSVAIVLGEIDQISAIRGGDVVRVRVLSTHKGEEAEYVTLLAGRGEFYAGTQQLLFLESFGDAGRYQYINRISRSDPDYDAKEACLKAHLKIEALDAEDLRREAVRQFLRDGARSLQSWTRWNMLRELDYILKKYSDLVRRTDRQELRELAKSSKDEEFRDKLVDLLDSTEPSEN